MSKAEEKITELMKKAKYFIPDGGYSEKELNLAFFMFIKGYRQAEKDNELTWEDMFNIFRLVNEVLDDYAEGKTKKEVGEEVLRRFKAKKKIIMDEKEYKECMSHIDITETLIRARLPRQMAAEGNTEDAIACAIAEGIRMGWDAHKKMVEEKQ